MLQHNCGPLKDLTFKAKLFWCVGFLSISVIICCFTSLADRDTDAYLMFSLTRLT